MKKLDGSSEEDLLKLLDAVTDEVEERPYTFTPPEPVTPGNDPEQKPTPEPGKTTDSPTPEPKEKEEPEPEPVKRVNPIAPEKIADVFVNFTSRVLELGGKKVYPSVILEPGDAAKLNDLSRRVRLGRPLSKGEVFDEATKEDPALIDVLLRWEKCDEAIKGAPFTDEEKEYLREPLGLVIEKYDFLKAGPELVLLMAVCLVMIPRITPLMPGFSSFLSETLSTKTA